MSGRDTAVVVTVEAEPVRRLLGPTAWVVLEHLDVCADVTDRGDLVVEATARSLAHSVSLGKDTAARALRRLSSAGIVKRCPQGRASGGRFAGGGYTLYLPAGLDRQERPGDSLPPQERSEPSRNPTSALPSEQLELVPTPKQDSQ